MSDARTTKIIGNYAELLISYLLIKRGYEVYKGLQIDDVDLIVKKNNQEARIQVKSSTLYKVSIYKKGYCFGIKQKGNKKVHRVDFIICVGIDKETLQCNKIWVFPARIFVTYKSMILNITTENEKWKRFENNFHEIDNMTKP